MKTAVVTGASSGIGLSIVLNLAKKNWRVLCVGHSEANCEKARAHILKQVPMANMEWFWGELMNQSEVNRISSEVSDSIGAEGKIDVLINNAGAVRGWYMTTEEGYEQQFAINHLASFLLTYRLLPYIQSCGGKVIMTSSGSHKGIKIHWEDVMFSRRYNPLAAYKQSKLCGILFAKSLVEKNIKAYAVDPGLVCTDIGGKTASGLINAVWKCRRRRGITADKAAETYVYLCETDEKRLYYKNCRAGKYSSEVTQSNEDRLFKLSEKLCGIEYQTREEEAT